MEVVPLQNGTMLTIREAQPQDAVELLAFSSVIGAETDFLTTGANGWQTSVEEEAERLAATLIAPDQGLFLGLIDGEIIALFSVTPLSDTPRTRQNAVFGVALKKSCWHLGIGSIALVLAIDRARDWGYHKLCLATHAENARALALYRRFGFEECGRRREHILIKGDYYDEILMELLL